MADFDQRDDLNRMNDMDEEIWDLLSLYLDGETTPSETQKVEALIASDARYAREFSLMQRGSQCLQAAPQFEPPTALRTAILAQTIYRPTFAMRVRDILRAMAPHRAVYGFVGAATFAAITFMAVRPAMQPLAVTSGSSVAVKPSTGDTTEKKVAFVPKQHSAKAEDMAFGEDVKADFVKLEFAILQNAKKKPVTQVSLRKAEVAIVTPQVKKEAPKRQEVKSGSTIQLALKFGTTPKVPSAHSRTSVFETPYTKKPMMDIENQRPSDSKPVEQVADARTSDPEANSTSAIGEAKITEKTPAPVVHVRYARVPTLPDFKSSREMRREENERNLGYSPAVLEGMKRQQPTIAFSTRF